jgi:predicted nucleic acid-binding protein
MLAADSSTLCAHFSDLRGADVEDLRRAMAANQLVLPPVVVSEVLSDSGADAYIEERLAALVLLPITDGYWARAGHARRLLFSKGLKAKVGDALIAQSCIDHDVALITRDRDFRHFAKHCGLKLA